MGYGLMLPGAAGPAAATRAFLFPLDLCCLVGAALASFSVPFSRGGELDFLETTFSG